MQLAKSMRARTQPTGILELRHPHHRTLYMARQRLGSVAIYGVPVGMTTLDGAVTLRRLCSVAIYGVPVGVTILFDADTPSKTGRR